MWGANTTCAPTSALVKSNNTSKTPFHNMDLVIFRKNTEGLYVGKEERIDADIVHVIKTLPRMASERIARSAFEYAQANGIATGPSIGSKSSLVREEWSLQVRPGPS